MGLPGLHGYDRERVSADNDAAEFILGELMLHQSPGGTSGRENPANSLHWFTLTEVGMFKQGTWYDQHYDASVLQAARRKKQRIFVLQKSCESSAGTRRMNEPLQGALLQIVPPHRACIGQCIATEHAR